MSAPSFLERGVFDGCAQEKDDGTGGNRESPSSFRSLNLEMDGSRTTYRRMERPHRVVAASLADEPSGLPRAFHKDRARQMASSRVSRAARKGLATMAHSGAQAAVPRTASIQWSAFSTVEMIGSSGHRVRAAGGSMTCMRVSLSSDLELGLIGCDRDARHAHPLVSGRGLLPPRTIIPIHGCRTPLRGGDQTTTRLEAIFEPGRPPLALGRCRDRSRLPSAQGS
jgi:hypothetical protein